MFGMVSRLSEQKRKLMLSVCFQSSLAAFLCKLCELILSIRFKDLKNAYIYLPIDPPLEEIRTEVVESGQKRWITRKYQV